MAKCEGCGYCCTHFIMPVALSDKFSDDDVRDLMKFLSYHGPAGRIETARTINGFMYKDNTPCRHLDPKTKKCKVHGTKLQPKLCQEGYCDRARGRGDDRDAYADPDAIKEIRTAEGRK